MHVLPREAHSLGVAAGLQNTTFVPGTRPLHVLWHFTLVYAVSAWLIAPQHSSPGQSAPAAQEIGLPPSAAQLVTAASVAGEQPAYDVGSTVPSEWAQQKSEGTGHAAALAPQ